MPTTTHYIHIQEEEGLRGSKAHVLSGGTITIDLKVGGEEYTFFLPTPALLQNARDAFARLAMELQAIDYKLNGCPDPEAHLPQAKGE